MGDLLDALKEMENARAEMVRITEECDRMLFLSQYDWDKKHEAEEAYAAAFTKAVHLAGAPAQKEGDRHG